MECLENVIGISNNTELPYYADLDSDLKDDIIASTSGLFVDKLPGGIDLMTIDDEDYITSVLKSALEARQHGIKTFQDDLIVAINNRFQPSKIKFNGEIGRRSVSSTISSSGNLQGHRYRVHEPVAGFITISEISIQLNGAATFNIYVGRNDVGEPAMQEEALYTFPVTSVIGNWANANMSAEGNEIKLPMEIEGIAQEYWIYWKRDENGGLYAKNNEIKCSTCSGKNRGEALAHYLDAKGISLPSATNLRSGINADSKGHGLSVTAVVGCDHDTVICREYEKQEAVAKIMQWAVLYKTGELWIEYIFKSGIVNKTNLQNREYLWGKRNHFRKEYDERITIIANRMQLGETGCYTCSEDRIKKGLIK